MTNIYNKRASAQLKDLIRQAQDGAPEDRLSVTAEIDMARAAASEAVALFDAVLQLKEPSVRQRAQAVALMQSALREVANLVKAQSSILSNLDGIMTMEQVLWITEAIKRLVREQVASSAKADEICEAIDLIQAPASSVAEAAFKVTFS